MTAGPALSSLPTFLVQPWRCKQCTHTYKHTPNIKSFLCLSHHHGLKYWLHWSLSSNICYRPLPYKFYDSPLTLSPNHFHQLSLLNVICRILRLSYLIIQHNLAHTYLIIQSRLQSKAYFKPIFFLFLIVTIFPGWKLSFCLTINNSIMISEWKFFL